MLQSPPPRRLHHSRRATKTLPCTTTHPHRHAISLNHRASSCAIIAIKIAPSIPCIFYAPHLHYYWQAAKCFSRIRDLISAIKERQRSLSALARRWSGPLWPRLPVRSRACYRGILARWRPPAGAPCRPFCRFGGAPIPTRINRVRPWGLDLVEVGPRGVQTAKIIVRHPRRRRSHRRLYLPLVESQKNRKAQSFRNEAQRKK